MRKEKRDIKILLTIYVFALIVSGFTAMIIPQGLRFLVHHIPDSWGIIPIWLCKIYAIALSTSHHMYYGFDWLAFGHYAIASSFYGVWKNPVKNRWIIEWSMMVSIAIIPFAFIMGAIRDIPLWWQLIDCSFGVLSLIVLMMIDRRIQIIADEEDKEDKITPKYF